MLVGTAFKLGRHSRQHHQDLECANFMMMAFLYPTKNLTVRSKSNFTGKYLKHYNSMLSIIWEKMAYQFEFPTKITLSCYKKEEII